jgi:hypothetical protein
VALIVKPFLFSWEDVERSSELQRLELVLACLPDEPIVAALEAHRGKGRDAYPVRPTWNALLAGVVFQHRSVESLLRELKRNAELREICGFNPLRGAQAVPTPWAMSRFLDNVISQRKLIEEMFDALVAELSRLLPSFGAHLAFDGKAIPSFSTGRKDRVTGQTSDPDADWGAKRYRGVDAAGKAWEKLNRWFGYQLHLIVDSSLELPVAFEVMRASTSEVTRLVPMVEALQTKHPEIVERCCDLAADRGLDSGEVSRELWREYGIKPVIDSRRLWRDEKQEPGFDASREITRLLDPDEAGNVVYTERGEVRCICPASGTERAMAFWGFEVERGCLHYRCPAASKGLLCAGRAECERAAMGRESSFGRVVRVPLEKDWRIFTPIPRETPSWRKLYAARTSVERVNARIDQTFGFEEHTIRGLAKMQTRMGLALAVMLAMAVAAIRAGRGEMLRSLVGSPRRRAA